MPTILFAIHKFNYPRDDGIVVPKAQRVYVRSEDLQPVTPITPLFMTTIISDPTVIPEKGAYMRYSWVCSENPYNAQGFSKSKAYNPFRPGDPQLKNHLQEILAVPWVKSVKYFGESVEVK